MKRRKKARLSRFENESPRTALLVREIAVGCLTVNVVYFSFFLLLIRTRRFPYLQHHISTLFSEIIVFPCLAFLATATATANGDFPKSIIFRPEGVDWWETHVHALRCELVAVFLHATHTAPALSYARNPRFGLFRLLPLLPSSPNEYSSENTDGWTD